MDASSSPGARPSEAAAAPRRSAPLVLPRIRASRHSAVAVDTPASETATTTTLENNGSSSGAVDASAVSAPVGAAVVQDVVSPVFPTASERRRELDEIVARREAENRAGVRHLARLIGRLDLGERCRWSGLLTVVFYLMTSLLWPSIYVASLGIICGATGVLACHEPYTIHRIPYVFVFVFLNVTMLGALVWTALDQAGLSNRDVPDNSVSVLFLAGMLLVGFVFHVRSLQAAWELIVQCKLLPSLIAAVVPERWRQRNDPTTAGPSAVSSSATASAIATAIQASRTAQSQADDEMPSRTSSVHSFEIDIQSYQLLVSPQARDRALASPPRSPLATPGKTPFRSLEDAAV